MHVVDSYFIEVST